jgi:DNA (cytosine-5)-methyltransferase 1
MNYLSVCSGIEAASVAWKSLGWSAIGFSEIETFPCSVLAHRFPDVKNYGDMTRFKEWDINETVDLLVGGTPCQSFSVAGLRGGLEDGRGNLALTYCRILQKFKPRWFVWENVPGVFSSWSGDSPDSLGVEAGPGREMDLDETSDFASILAGFSELGYGYAWSVRDAQYFGVPQRRRRVFVVGYLGDWRRSAEVLFEPGCLSGNTAKSRKQKQDVAGTLASRTTAGGGLGTDFDLSGGLQLAFDLLGKPATEVAKSASVHTPLRARIPGQVENSTVTVIASTGNTSHCLNAGGMGRQDYETETMVVAFTQNGRDEVRELKIPGALPASPATRQQTYLSQISGVRRLTPLECERLQGFPDDWTLVPHRGKQAADGPRYKSIGTRWRFP